MPLWLFAFLAAFLIIASLGVVLQKNPVHSLVALVAALLLVAVLFIGLDGATIGFLQAIVYAGAIMVLFLFVIWLLNLQIEPPEGGRTSLKIGAAIFTATLVAELFLFLVRVPNGEQLPVRVTGGYGSIHDLAEMLFSDYLVAFEATSILLLLALVGAVALARRIPGSGLRSGPRRTRARVAGPGSAR